MATVTDAVASGRFVSVELLPPRSPAGEETLRAALDDLAPLAPAFVAVTYGANGSDRGRTASLVKQLAGTAATAVPHLTCAAHRRMELSRLLTRYRAMGIDNVLALHGDPPLAADTALPEGELRYALDLVRLARERGIACVGVAVHPEGHPAAESRDADLAHQANKLRHADFAITQFVNRADDYFRFVDEMLKRGAEAPVIPGIRPISNLRQAQRMAAMSGAAIPAALADQLTAAADDSNQAFRIGVDYAVTVCARLLEGGAPGLHFFTMNRATSTLHVCEQLGWTTATINGVGVEGTTKAGRSRIVSMPARAR